MLKEVNKNYIKNNYEAEIVDTIEQICIKFCDQIREVINSTPDINTKEAKALVIDLMLKQLESEIQKSDVDSSRKERLLGVCETLNVVTANEFLN